MNLNKFFYNLIISLKSINRYGILLILKSLVFEIYYSLKFKDNLFFRSDDNENKNEINYARSKLDINYGTPNIPTPYYFLHLLKLYLKKEEINNFNFIDMGCGSGRLVNYLDKFFKRDFIGLDINNKIIDENKIKFARERNFFYTFDLRKINNPSDLNFLSFVKKENKKNIVFISDSIDGESIEKILPVFKKFLGKFLFVMINQKNLNLFSKYKCKKNIFFKDKSRNISFFEI